VQISTGFLHGRKKKMPNDNAENEFDWTLTTWEGARKEQMRRCSEMSLRDIVSALEEMQELADKLQRDQKRD
jgi:hypothetical protein